jgi:fermentation-respiration switch protein FrsA (DUF1100 family)
VDRAVAADAHYRSWFEQRFALAPDAVDPHPVFDPERLSATGDRPVFLIHGDQDEVVDGEDTARAAARARARGRPWTLIREDGIGHVPRNAEQAARRYEHVRGALGPGPQAPVRRPRLSPACAAACPATPPVRPP